MNRASRLLATLAALLVGMPLVVMRPAAAYHGDCTHPASHSHDTTPGPGPTIDPEASPLPSPSPNPSLTASPRPVPSPSEDLSPEPQPTPTGDDATAPLHVLHGQHPGPLNPLALFSDGDIDGRTISHEDMSAATDLVVDALETAFDNSRLEVEFALMLPPPSGDITAAVLRGVSNVLAISLSIARTVHGVQSALQRVLDECQGDVHADVAAQVEADVARAHVHANVIDPTIRESIVATIQRNLASTGPAIARLQLPYLETEDLTDDGEDNATPVPLWRQGLLTAPNIGVAAIVRQAFEAFGEPSSAKAYLDAADRDVANGAYKSAYRNYRRAYQLIVQ